LLEPDSFIEAPFFRKIEGEGKPVKKEKAGRSFQNTRSMEKKSHVPFDLRWR
jgi:hypothetical protein